MMMTLFVKQLSALMKSLTAVLNLSIPMLLFAYLILLFLTESRLMKRYENYVLKVLSKRGWLPAPIIVSDSKKNSE